MSHTADLETDSDSDWIPIGWLHPDHPFPQSDPDPHFLARLKIFVDRSNLSTLSVRGGFCGGVHICEFCERAVDTGSVNVVGRGKMYHAPRMIGHYVEDHRYAPPTEFIDAILSCPLPGTRAFIAAAVPHIFRNDERTQSETFTLRIDHDAALVLFDLCSRLCRDHLSPENSAEKRSFWSLLGAIASCFDEVNDQDFPDHLAIARQFAQKQRSDDETIELPRFAAIVLFDVFSKRAADERFFVDDPVDRAVIEYLLGEFITNLVETFDARYLELLKEACKQLERRK